MDDLNSFISKLKQNNYIVNGGPQSWRAQSDSLTNKISLIDNHIRDSLAGHNDFHCRAGKIDSKRRIPVSKFRYKNIHINIGNVKYYTTKTNDVTDVITTPIDNISIKSK